MVVNQIVLGVDIQNMLSKTLSREERLIKSSINPEDGMIYLKTTPSTKIKTWYEKKNMDPRCYIGSGMYQFYITANTLYIDQGQAVLHLVIDEYIYCPINSKRYWL